ncbi:MAG: peptidoglycan-associated lipoprotein Pal [SAR324 cluster bacterium]|nr:peptidoglycan-associated lipoprotein Pal [SAR324 cluster bacterium]
MKTNWLGWWILVALAFLLAGCPPAEEAKKPQETAAVATAAAAAKVEAAKVEAVKVEAAREPEFDASKLPPPRPPLADTPDLQNARFRITERSLELMQEDGVPDDVIKGLSSLKGTEFTNASEFFDAVRGAVGAQALEDNQSSIVRNSLAVALAVEPAFPGSKLKLTALQPEGTPGFGAVYFDYDRSNIRPEFLDSIRANAQKFMADSSLRVTLEGHADERGTTEYNLALGERRANAVREALIAEGVSSGQITTVSFGEERPAAAGHDEEAWAKNRRAVFVVTQ